MRVNASMANVAGLTRDLKRRWDETKVHWRDVRALDFEQHYLEPLFECVSTAVAMTEKLDQALAKIRSDCE